MSYLGKTQFKSSDIQRFDVTSSTSATHVLSWTAANEQSLIVTINGVKQQDDAYSISGSPTTVTLTSALVATDKLEIVGIVDVGTMNVPGVGSVQTELLADDAVTAAKMADDAVGVAVLSATGTASSSTFLRGDNAWASAAGGFNKWTPVTATDTTFDLQSGTTKLIVEVQAAGGHGGTSDSGTRTGGPGGGGAYAKKLLTGMSDTDTLNITIGAAAAVAASGTTTSVASASGTSFTTITCTGGAGGATAAGSFGVGGAGGAVPTTGDLNIKGQDGAFTDPRTEGVFGANSMFGFGGQNSASVTVAQAATGYGAGGQGGRGASNAGAAGTPGLVIIWEYK